MKPQLYLHIGRPKTGSTALQSFLYSNREPLRRKGVVYPETGRYQRASHKLSLVYLPRLPDSEAVEGVHAGELYAGLAEEIRGSGASSAVVSSEHFWLVDPAQLPASLKEEFDITIVAYLRRQDDVLISSFIQEVKSGSLSIDVDLDRYISDRGRLKLLDYHRTLERWADVFSPDRICARVYENLAPEQGIERDFLALIGLDDDSDFQFSDVRRNTSPSLEVLRLVEDLEALDLDRLSRRRLIALFGKASSTLGLEQGTAASTLFTPEQRQRVLDQFTDSNKRLAKTFMGSDQAPFPGLEEAQGEYDATTKPGALDTEQRVRLLTATIAEQQRQLGILQNRLARAEEALGVGGGTRVRERKTHVSNSLLAKLKRLFGADG